MSFYKRYELVRLMQEGEAKTFNAVEIATKRPVLLHMLAPSAVLSAASIREIVARAEHQPRVIEVGEFAGSYYIAVEPSDSSQSFREWVDSLPGEPLPKAAAPPPRPVPPPAQRARRNTEIRKLNVQPTPPPAVPEAKSGPFTHIFGVPKAEIAGKAEPGEFTKLFYGNAPGKPEIAPELPANSTGTGGEFTKFFGGRSLDQPAKERDQSADEFKPVFDDPLSEPEDAPPVRAVSQTPQWPSTPERDDHTGEYTKFFGNALPSEPVDIQAEQAKQAGVVEPKAKPFQQASAFTRVFGPEKTSVKTPPPAPIPHYPSPSDGPVSMIFGPPTPPAATSKPLAFDAPAEADDYMRVIGAPATTGLMTGVAEQQMPPPGKKHTGLIIVLVIVGVTLLSLLIWAIVARSGK